MFSSAAFVKENVKLCNSKGRRHFVFHDLYFYSIADIMAIIALDSPASANIKPERGVELERAAPCCCFGVSIHDPYFFSDLVDEDSAGVAFREGRCELSERL